MLLGLVQQLVTGVQHVLGIVEFAGDGVLDVVDQLEHVATRDHTTCRHGDAAGLFHDRAQLIERFKYSVHGTPSRRSCCYQCAWCYPCDYASAAGVSPAGFQRHHPGPPLISATLCQYVRNSHIELHKDRPNALSAERSLPKKEFVT